MNTNDRPGLEDSGPDRDEPSRKNNTPESRTPALTAFQRDLLTALAREAPASGRDLMAALEARYGDDVTRGRLYPNLSDLVERGYIRQEEFDGRTTHNTLTTRGREWVGQTAARYGEIVDEVRA